MDAAPAIATITTTTTAPMEDAMETTTEDAPVQQEGTAEEHALRHTKPSFDYAIGTRPRDHVVEDGLPGGKCATWYGMAWC